MMPSVNHYLAPAKINLTLKVIGRLPDGYHELDTWMHKVQLYDEITIELNQSKKISLRCPNSDLPEDDSNLVVRAAQCFYALIKEQPSLHITLKKNIPVSAGLGGGSSDCATVLLGLNALFDNPISHERLLLEGKLLGADVPFFIQKYISAKAQGIGEILTPVQALPPCFILLVNPGIEVSTGWVFSQIRGEIPELEYYSQQSEKTLVNDNFALTRDSKTYNLTRAYAEPNWPKLFNDLEEVTLAHFPKIKLIKHTLLEHGALRSLMSGSGSTVFGIYTKESDAKRGKKAIQAQYPDWRVFLTKPLIA